MPYTTLTAGSTITASWGNANVRDQVITPFANATARDSAITSPVEGMYAYLSDTDALTYYTGSAWKTIHSAEVNYTPSFALTASTSNPTVGSSQYDARYRYVGGEVHYWGYFIVKSGFAAGSGTYRVSLPENASSTMLDMPVGNVFINDSGTALRMGQMIVANAAYATIYFNNAAATITDLNSGGPGTAWGTDDYFRWSITYSPA